MGGGRVARRAEKLARKTYERELLRLQTERAKLLERVRADGARLVVILEGREAAGKGGSVKRATGHFNPRVARIAVLEDPVRRRKLSPPVLEMPERPEPIGHRCPPRGLRTCVPDHAASI